MLRAFRPGDEQACADLLTSAGMGNWDVERLERTLLCDSLSPQGAYLATRDDVPVGCALACDRTPPGARKRVGELRWMAIHPDHRGHRLGVVLCAAVVEHLLKRGFEFVYLYVDDGQRSDACRLAVKAFLKTGFLPVVRNDSTRARWGVLWDDLNWSERGVASLPRVARDVTYCVHSRFNEPTLTVSCGETFIAETELCTGDWLKSIDNRWEPGIGFGPNPTVVVEVDGPGRIVPGRAVGDFTLLDIDAGHLALAKRGPFQE
jgi:GNAT superfamily N-acetyltransferase